MSDFPPLTKIMEFMHADLPRVTRQCRDRGINCDSGKVATFTIESKLILYGCSSVAAFKQDYLNAQADLMMRLVEQRVDLIELEPKFDCLRAGVYWVAHVTT